MFICFKSTAQKFSYEFKVGLREEIVTENVLSGNIVNENLAVPTIGVDIIRNLEGNFTVPIGLFIQNYAGRTLIDGLDMGATLNRNWFMGISGGIERFMFKDKKINLSIGLTQQLLLTPNSPKPIASNSFPKNSSLENIQKTETLRAFRNINPISQIGAKLWFPFQNMNGVYLGYAYNWGWNSLLERDISYNLTDNQGNTSNGQGKFLTNGSGWQLNFGFRLKMAND